MSEHDSRVYRGDRWRVGFETRRVNDVLEALALTGFRPELYRMGRAWELDARLTCADFRELFPTFPVCLTAIPVGGLSGLEPRAFLKALAWGRAGTRYLAEWTALQPEAAGRPVVAVVPAGIRGGLALHDAAGPIGAGGFSIALPAGADPPCRTTAEPVAGILAAIAATRWTPGRLVRISGSADPPSVPLPVAPPADLVRLLGPGPALVVLQWVVAVAARGRSVHRTDTETVGVTPTDQGIADWSGLSLHQVRRGLAELERQGLVTRSRGGDRRIIWVTDAAWLAFGLAGPDECP